MGLFPSKPGAVRRVPTLPQECWASALDFLPYVDASVARRTCVLWRKSIDALLKNAQKKNPNIPRIARLVSSLRIGDPEGKRQAAMALDAMLLEEEDPIAAAADCLTIADVGGIEALVDLLEGGDYDAKVCAAAALARLSECLVDDNAPPCKPICIGHVIQPMVNLLSTHDGDGRGAYFASLTLANFLLKSPHMNTAIMDAGAIAPFVELLRADDVETQENVLLALQGMICHFCAPRKEPTSALLDAGVVSPLVDLLKTGSEYAQIRALELVLWLQYECGRVDRRRMIADAYSPALELLHTGSNEIKKQAARMLSKLAQGHRLIVNHPALADSGAIPSLVEMMRSDDPETQEDAAKALGSLARDHPVNRMAITDAGALLPLIDALRTSVATMPPVSRELDNRVWELDPTAVSRRLWRPVTFANSLGILVRGIAASQTACFEAGGFVPLLEMLRVDHQSSKFWTGTTIASSGASAIGALVRGNAVIGASLVNAELLARVMALLRLESSRFCDGALELIADLAFDNVANQAALVDAGAIAAIVAILRRREETVAPLAATALGFFGRNYRAALVDAGAVALLTELAQNPGPLPWFPVRPGHWCGFDSESAAAKFVDDVNDRMSKAASSALSMIPP